VEQNDENQKVPNQGCIVDGVVRQIDNCLLVLLDLFEDAYCREEGTDLLRIVSLRTDCISS
jgi:hypothetical protein